MQILTFKELQDEVLAYLDESGDAGTTLTLVKYFLNEAQVKRCDQYPWPFLRWNSPETITLVAGQRLYTLHPECWKPIHFWNRTKNAYMVEMSERQLEEQGVDWINNTGTRYFRLAEIWPVQYQPTSASAITIVSTSAADTGASYNITITGIVSDGVTTETLTPAGTTPVVGTRSFSKILGVSLTTALAGTLTLTSNGGAVTNLTLVAGELGRQYRTIELLSQPTAGEVIEYQFLRSPVKMVNNYDVPSIPAPHSRILVWDALQMMTGYLTEMSGTAVQLFVKSSADLEWGMLQTYMPGQTVGAMPQYTRMLQDYSDAWGVY